jgi:hypothetical protein
MKMQDEECKSVPLCTFLKDRIYTPEKSHLSDSV